MIYDLFIQYFKCHLKRFSLISNEEKKNHCLAGNDIWKEAKND